MKYLERLKAAGDLKKGFAGGQAPPKLTKSGSVSSAGTVPPTKISYEAGSCHDDLEAHTEESQVAALSHAQESGRREVLAQLEAHPTIKRAFVNRFEPDGTMVVTLAIRDVGTGELLIPAARFRQGSLDDYAALLEIIGGAP